MTIVDQLKQLAAAMMGSGTAEDVPGETVSDVIAYITENWSAIKTAIKAE